MRSTGWLPRPGKGKRSERHRFRWAAAAPPRKGRDALQGTWIEYAVERGGKRTYANCFFTSLAVTAEDTEGIARAGRACWKIENEGFDCLAWYGLNFGHGKDAPANVLNLFACALQAVLHCVCTLWRQGRRKLVTRRDLFRELQVALHWFCFPDWPTLLAALRDKRGLPAGPGRGLDSAQLRADSGRRWQTATAGVRPAAGSALGGPAAGPRHSPASRPALPRGGLSRAAS